MISSTQDYSYINPQTGRKQTNLSRFLSSISLQLFQQMKEFVQKQKSWYQTKWKRNPHKIILYEDILAIFLCKQKQKQILSYKNNTFKEILNKLNQITGKSTTTFDERLKKKTCHLTQDQLKYYIRNVKNIQFNVKSKELNKSDWPIYLKNLERQNIQKNLKLQTKTSINQSTFFDSSDLDFDSIEQNMKDHEIPSSKNNESYTLKNNEISKTNNKMIDKNIKQQKKQQKQNISEKLINELQQKNQIQIAQFGYISKINQKDNIIINKNQNKKKLTVEQLSFKNTEKIQQQKQIIYLQKKIKKKYEKQLSSFSDTQPQLQLNINNNVISKQKQTKIKNMNIFSSQKYQQQNNKVTKKIQMPQYSSSNKKNIYKNNKMIQKNKSKQLQSIKQKDNNQNKQGIKNDNNKKNKKQIITEYSKQETTDNDQNNQKKTDNNKQITNNNSQTLQELKKLILKLNKTQQFQKASELIEKRLQTIKKQVKDKDKNIINRENHIKNHKKDQIIYQNDQIINKNNQIKKQKLINQYESINNNRFMLIDSNINRSISIDIIQLRYSQNNRNEYMHKIQQGQLQDFKSSQQLQQLKKKQQKQQQQNKLESQKQQKHQPKKLQLQYTQPRQKQQLYQQQQQQHQQQYQQQEELQKQQQHEQGQQQPEKLQLQLQEQPIQKQQEQIPIIYWFNNDPYIYFKYRQDPYNEDRLMWSQQQDQLLYQINQNYQINAVQFQLLLKHKSYQIVYSRIRFLNIKLNEHLKKYFKHLYTNIG